MSDKSADKLLAELEARGLKIRGRAASTYQSADALLDILRARKLQIDRPDIATHYLDTIGHHRLSAFYPSFYSHEAEKWFDADVPTSIDDVFHLYSFDRRLRLLVIGPLEKVEVALRALIVKEVGDYLRRQNAVEGEPREATEAREVTIDLFDERFYDLIDKNGNHNQQNHFNYKTAKHKCKQDARAYWSARFPSAKNLLPNLTKNQWAAAFEVHYKTLPAWAILQTASFGPLVYIYASLKREIGVAIAERLKFPYKVMRTTLFGLKELRNACAHHEPIWNWDSRSRAVHLSFPGRYRAAVAINADNERQLYAYCAIIHILLSVLSGGRSTWHRRLKKLVNEFNTMYSASMGFPEHWQTMPFWCVSNVADEAKYKRLRSRVHAKP